MRRAVFAGLACLALIMPTTAGDVTPKSPTAGATLDVVAPDTSVQPGERCELKIEGLTLAEVQEAMAAGRFDLTVFPLAGTKVDANYDWLFGQLELEFEAKKPGEYLVKIVLDRTPTVDDPLEIAAAVVTVAGDDNEEDDENPPLPPIPSGRRELIVVWESGEPSQAVSSAILSPELKSYVAEKGHHLWIVDQDAVGPEGKTAPAGFVGWLNLAKQTTLPHLFITAASSDGGSADILWQGPPPATAAEWLELIKKYGG